MTKHVPLVDTAIPARGSTFPRPFSALFIEKLRKPRGRGQVLRSRCHLSLQALRQPVRHLQRSTPVATCDRQRRPTSTSTPFIRKDFTSCQRWGLDSSAVTSVGLAFRPEPKHRASRISRLFSNKRPTVPSGHRFHQGQATVDVDRVAAGSSFGGGFGLWRFGLRFLGLGGGGACVGPLPCGALPFNQMGTNSRIANLDIPPLIGAESRPEGPPGTRGGPELAKPVTLGRGSIPTRGFDRAGRLASSNGFEPAGQFPLPCSLLIQPMSGTLISVAIFLNVLLWPGCALPAFRASCTSGFPFAPVRCTLPVASGEASLVPGRPT